MSTTPRAFLRTPEADEYRKRIAAHIEAEDWKGLEATLIALRLRTRPLHG